MNQWKLNISPWYSLGLAAVLVVLCLVIATGTTWARYRTETSEELHFSVRSPVSVRLGKVESVESAEDTDKGKFVPTNEGAWIPNEDGQLQLDFAVGNGVSDNEFEKKDQQIRIHVVSTLGIQTGKQPLTLKLKVPSVEEPTEETTEAKPEALTEKTTQTQPEELTETQPEETQETQPEEITQTQPEDQQEPQPAFDVFEAEAVYIRAGSPMYTTFGEGWVFRFMDEDGEELGWLLEGGELSYIEMSLVMEGGLPADLSLLQLQIDSTYIPE